MNLTCPKCGNDDTAEMFVITREYEQPVLEGSHVFDVTECGKCKAKFKVRWQKTAEAHRMVLLETSTEVK